MQKQITEASDRIRGLADPLGDTVAGVLGKNPPDDVLTTLRKLRAIGAGLELVQASDEEMAALARAGYSFREE